MPVQVPQLQRSRRRKQGRKHPTCRLAVDELAPAINHAMNALEAATRKTELEPALHELARARDSQLNCCAYCVDMHSSLDGDLRGTWMPTLVPRRCWHLAARLNSQPLSAEVLTVLIRDDLSGWIWVRNAAGRESWVPADPVEALAAS